MVSPTSEYFRVCSGADVLLSKLLAPSSDARLPGAPSSFLFLYFRVYSGADVQMYKIPHLGLVLAAEEG